MFHGTFHNTYHGYYRQSCVASTGQSGVTRHSSKSSLNAGPSTSQNHHVSLVDIGPFPKEGVRKETRKRKSRVSAAVTDTLVMVALDHKYKPAVSLLNVTG